MSQDILVSIIMTLCSGPVGHSRYDMVKATETRVECFDKYVNCAVKSDGTILTLSEFQVKCTKEVPK